jgi:DNA polymerase-4
VPRDQGRGEDPVRPVLHRDRGTALPNPTASAADIERAALDVVGRFDLTRPVRLLGVRAEF